MATTPLPDEVIASIRSAFLPLRCGIEVFDYEQKIRFRVFDDRDNVVLAVPEVKLSLARSPTDFSDFLREARKLVEEKGYTLEPWKL